jgi:dihydroorotase
MGKYLIKDANIVNNGITVFGSVLINENTISKIYTDTLPSELPANTIVVDAKGKYLLPGVIDDQVHFRQPGLTHKGDIHSETRAAVAGGVTSIMEMPNTNPQTTTQALLKEKYEMGAHDSMVNYSFYMGATNDNIKELLNTDPKNVCGIKVFMGSSTGNMLVDKRETLEAIFKESPLLIATHCEDEAMIQQNIATYREKYHDHIPIQCHPDIRSAEACYKSSAMAVELAHKYNTRLHILHLSTAREMSLFDNTIALKDKKITAEVCVHHLWFSDKDYAVFGNYIKWNPAIKSEIDKEGLWEALLENRIDVIATDHAPHTLEEKQNGYTKAPSGGPLVQHSLVAMLEQVKKGRLSIEKVVEKMCHAPAELFRVEKRGFIKEGYFADLVLVDINSPWTVNKENILYKCGWSPFEGIQFHSKVTHTFVNGQLVYDNGRIEEGYRGERLRFK